MIAVEGFYLPKKSQGSLGPRVELYQRCPANCPYKYLQYHTSQGALFGSSLTILDYYNSSLATGGVLQQKLIWVSEHFPLPVLGYRTGSGLFGKYFTISHDILAQAPSLPKSNPPWAGLEQDSLQPTDQVSKVNDRPNFSPLKKKKKLPNAHSSWCGTGDSEKPGAAPEQLRVQEILR